MVPDTGGTGNGGEYRGHERRLRVMYAANLVVSGPLGLAVLLDPGVMRSLLGVPSGDPILFGVAAGAVPFAFGVAAILGLRAPVRFSPVLGLQAVYKAAFLAAVILPLAIAGDLAAWTLPLAGIFVFFVVGDLVAIPLPYLLPEPPERPGSETEPGKRAP